MEDRIRERGNGRKDDCSKLRYDLVPLGVMRLVVLVLTRGAEKYAPHNWQKVPGARERYYSAACRHIENWWHGERLDEEWQIHHLAHAICCLMFLLWFDRLPANTE